MARLRMTLMEVARSLKYSLLDERPDGVSCVNSERIEVLREDLSIPTISIPVNDFLSLILIMIIITIIIITITTNNNNNYNNNR